MGGQVILVSAAAVVAIGLGWLIHQDDSSVDPRCAKVREIRMAGIKIGGDPRWIASNAGWSWEEFRAAASRCGELAE